MILLNSLVKNRPWKIFFPVKFPPTSSIICYTAVFTIPVYIAYSTLGGFLPLKSRFRKIFTGKNRHGGFREIRFHVPPVLKCAI